MIDRAHVQRLMMAAADGERAAVEPLFALLWPVTVAYATKLVGGDAALGEDCAQDALVKLFGQLDRFDRERDGLTWALTHATWQCRTARRARERRREDHVSAESIEDARELLDERELVRTAMAALDSLPARDREVIAASLTDDDELRRTLAPATFRKRLERALARLRTSWRSRHGTL